MNKNEEKNGQLKFNINFPYREDVPKIAFGAAK